MKAITSLFHVLKTNFGHVRVDFAQPFSLKVNIDIKVIQYIYQLWIVLLYYYYLIKIVKMATTN